MKPEARLRRIREILELAEVRNKTVISFWLTLSPDEIGEILQLTNYKREKQHAPAPELAAA